MFDIPISESWQQIRFRKYLWAIDTAVRLLSIHWLGGIPVDRTNPARVVEQVAIRIGEAGEMTMTLEGTRGKVRKWKTGLLRIARRSDNLLVAGSDEHWFR